MTEKKRVWIPGYVRLNGNRVDGHWREQTEDKATRSAAATRGWKGVKRRMKA